MEALSWASPPGRLGYILSFQQGFFGAGFVDFELQLVDMPYAGLVSCLLVVEELEVRVIVQVSID